jgi:hypothetical protein
MPRLYGTLFLGSEARGASTQRAQRLATPRLVLRIPHLFDDTSTRDLHADILIEEYAAVV